MNGDPVYVKLVDDAVEYAVKSGEPDETSTVSLGVQSRVVHFGNCPKLLSTEVDPRLSFKNTEASVECGKRIIAMNEDMGILKQRVPIKLAATRPRFLETAWILFDLRNPLV